MCAPWWFKSLDERKKTLFRDYFHHFFLELEIILISVTEKNACLSETKNSNDKPGWPRRSLVLCAVLGQKLTSQEKNCLISTTGMFFVRQHVFFLFTKVSFTTCLERHVAEDSLSLLI